MQSKRQIEARLDRLIPTLIADLDEQIKRPIDFDFSKPVLRARFRDLQNASVEHRRLDAVRIANDLAVMLQVKTDSWLGERLRKALTLAAMYRQLRKLP